MEHRCPRGRVPEGAHAAPGLAFTGAGGQDRLKGKVFRIATLGYAGPYDVITAIAALEFTLKDLGYKFEMGKGVAAAVQSLADQ